MTNLFLLASFFAPRLTLACCYIFGFMPANTSPFAVDVICFFLFPRFLIAYWAYELGLHPLIWILFIVGGLLELSAKGRGSSSSK